MEHTHSPATPPYMPHDFSHTDEYLLLLTLRVLLCVFDYH